ncbi:MAG: GntR family transcriptional regulator, partial [Shewanella algae]
MSKKNNSLRQQAYNWIKQQIITLELPPGSLLREIEISHELGLGRTPIREAIQQLESEKLVVVVPRKGTFVTNINFGDFEKLLDARIMIELHVAKTLAGYFGRIDPQAIDDLYRMFDQVPELVQKRDI